MCKSKYTVADLVVIRNYILKIDGFDLDANMIKYYDQNGDGEVDIGDFMKIAKMIGIVEGGTDK